MPTIRTTTAPAHRPTAPCSHGSPPKAASRITVPAIQGAVWVVERLLGLAFAFACVAGLYNVLSDDAEVTRTARMVACGGSATGCDAQMVRFLRSPVAQSYDFAISSRSTVNVRCVREWIFAGAYACTASTLGGALAPAPSTPPASPAPARPRAPRR